jgi:hypothetical protein
VLHNCLGWLPTVSQQPNIRIGVTSKKALKIDGFTLYRDGGRIAVAAAEPAFTATTHDIADPDANGREAIYLVLVSRAGAVTIVKGGDAVLGAGVDPAITADCVAIARVKINHNGTQIFDATTDDLDAAHLTVVYQDMAEALDVASGGMDRYST